jgi:hypothetical protein
MTAAAIRRDVRRGLGEASSATGKGKLTVVLVQASGGPTTPWGAGAATETDTPLRAVIGSYDRRLVDGSLVRADDLRVMVEAGPVEPSTADTLKIGGVAHSIVSVRPTSPGGVALMWELQCRR